MELRKICNHPFLISGVRESLLTQQQERSEPATVLKALIEHDLRKCDALVGADAFWECTGPGVRGDGVEQLDEARAKATDEVALSDVSSSLRRSPAAQARVARLAAFQGRPDDSSSTR